MEKNNIDWDLYANSYDLIVSSSINPAYQELLNKVHRSFSFDTIQPGQFIVDFGGGTGNFSIPLAEKYPDSEFMILDVSHAMLKKAEEKALDIIVNYPDSPYAKKAEKLIEKIKGIIKSQIF